MDFRLSEEQRLVQETARDFVDKEIVPHVRDWEAKGEIPRSFYAKMAGLGFLGAPVPEKYGGGGGGYLVFAPPPHGDNPRGPPLPPPVPLPNPPSGTTLRAFWSPKQKRGGGHPPP